MMIKQNVNRILPAMSALLMCLNLTACGGESQSTKSTLRTTTEISLADFLGRGVSNGGLGNDTYNEDAVYETAAGISKYVGLWKYEDGTFRLEINESGTWELFDDEENKSAVGTLLVDENGISLYHDETGMVVMQLYLTENGELIDSENGWLFLHADDSGSSEPYFTANGLYINAELDKGPYVMNNGYATYVGDNGDGYTVGECFWEVTRTYDKTQDGIREIKIEAVTYVPYSSIGDFDEKPKHSLYHQLYDFYSGKWFTRIDEYKTSSRGKNYYLHNVECNGQSGIIEFTRSTDWQYDVDDWARIATTHYHVYMPEWYDGLILTLEPLPDTYEDFMVFDHRHSDYAEASILDIEPVDAYGCLFFNICE